MIEIASIINIFGLLISLVGIFIGLVVASKCSGKLKISIILLDLVIAILFFSQVSQLGFFLNIMTGSFLGAEKNINYVPKSNEFFAIINTIIIILTVLSLFFMKKMIDDIEKASKYKRR